MDNLLIRYHTCGVCVHDIEYACRDFKSGKNYLNFFFLNFFFSCGSLFVILNLLYGGSDNVIVHFDLDQSIHHGVEAEHKFFILLPTSNQDIFWQPPKFFSIDGLFLL